MNLNDKNSKGTYWVSFFINTNTALYFDSFGKSKIKDKSITHNVFRIRDNESIMCGFYCIAFIYYMLARNLVFDYTNLFSPNDPKKNDKIIYKYFRDKYGERSQS